MIASEQIKQFQKHCELIVNYDVIMPFFCDVSTYDQLYTYDFFVKSMSSTEDSLHSKSDSVDSVTTNYFLYRLRSYHSEHYHYPDSGKEVSSTDRGVWLNVQEDL